MLTLLLLAACSRKECSAGDVRCVHDTQMAKPVWEMAHWQAAMTIPLGQRFGPAPPELVAHLRLQNRKDGIAQDPVVAEMPPDFRRDVEGALSDLPDVVRRAVASKLVGIYFVDDLGTTGITDKIVNAHGEPVAAYIALDRAVLSQRTANAWISWKENTPFRAGGHLSLVARIETVEQDSRRNAIQYILLHEIGHAIAIGSKFHPVWWLDKPASNVAAYPFMALSWRLAADGKSYVPRVEDDFGLRRDVVYYHGAHLDNEQMVAVYEGLAGTNFPSLYAATNPYDDFAESFAGYVHTVLMHKPWEIEVRDGSKVLVYYGSCWEAPRCAAKRQLIEAFLARS